MVASHASRKLAPCDQVVPLIRSEEAIAELPDEPVPGAPGARRIELWRDHDDEAGVLVVEGGRRYAPPVDRTHDHHLWVMTGRATILGDVLRSGSYVHVPAGLEHEVDATDTGGCRIFYLRLPPRRA